MCPCGVQDDGMVLSIQLSALSWSLLACARVLPYGLVGAINDVSCGPSETASDAGCATELRQTAIETRRLPHHDARPPDTHRRHSVSRRPRRNEPQRGRLTRRNSSSTSCAAGPIPCSGSPLQTAKNEWAPT